MLVHIEVHRRKYRYKQFRRLSAFFRGEGCGPLEAARFARQTLDISPPRNAQIIPFAGVPNGPPADLFD